ncbi:tripartite tricarboxylate transporter TctB family protein [Microbacterium kribbense]|uniref:Tripartite tricarboxylate transporter TctB family protein n=1 Tax=Microbacterium kribbense TaxID=433645 RepID=A0ABP7G363_9MICO
MTEQTPSAPPAEDTTPIPIDDTAPPSGPIANLVASLAAATVGTVGVVFAIGFGVGSPSQPGPGLWPLIVSITIVVLSLVQIVVGRRAGDGEVFVRASWMALAGLVTLILYVAAMPHVGFEIPTAVMTFIWLRLLGKESWLSTVIGTVAIVVAFYLIFVVALQTSIPHLF